MINKNDIIEELIQQIKDNAINWTNLDAFKKYIKSNNQSLRDIPILQYYSLFLQSNKFLFDCIDTYFSISDEYLYILSKKQNSLNFRLDRFEIKSENIVEESIDESLEKLLRLKNAITITNDDSSKECSQIYDVLIKIKVENMNHFLDEN